MKARVVVEFKDKYSGKIYRVDDVITVSKERFAEILETGAFIEEAKEKKAKKETA